MEEIKFLRVREVKIPTRGTIESAGIDFYIPTYSNPIIIEPRRRALIHTGIKVSIPKGYALIAFNKSGIAVKKNLQIGACVVDSDYQGEIFVHLYNTGLTEVTLNPDEKFIQFLLLPVPETTLNEVFTEEQLYTSTSERGDGCMGSTNNK